MSLFKKRSQTPEPEPVAEPSPKPGGKGRPTPRRKDQQAKNLHPVVPKDRATAKREARAARDAAWKRQNEAMVTGEEKYLPSREKGPIKRYIRDFVDARFNLGEYFMPLIFVLLIISLSMLNGGGSSAHEGSTQEKAQHNVVAGGGNDVAFYPMTFPILVGPGTIATIIVIQSQAQGLGGHAAVAAALAAVLTALGIVLYFSASIGARLSMTMRTIMTRLMGMILASIAVQMIVVGIQHLFPGLAR